MVEVMIVLATSGALFVAAAIMISGKQNQAGFNQGIQQIRAQIQQAMNEVANGYFPAQANFRCTAGAGGPVTLTAAGAQAQGANAGCVFAGKVMQFGINGTDPEQFAVYTMAGAQKDSAGREVTSLNAAVPRVIARGTASPAGYPDITVPSILQNGLETAGPGGIATRAMWYNNGGADVTTGAVAFVPSFAAYTGTNITSGSQQLSVVAIPGTDTNMSRTAMADAINANITSGIANPSNGVSVCFASGGTNQSGLITIGGNSKPLNVNLRIMQGTRTCGR
jgi:hypothetical protein